MTKRARRPSDYRLHAGLLKGGVYVVFAVLSIFLLGFIKLLGVFDMRPGWLIVALAAIIAILYVLLRGVLKLFALTCPECGLRTLEAFPTSRWETRHKCRNCGLTLVSGSPIEPDDR